MMTTAVSAWRYDDNEMEFNLNSTENLTSFMNATTASYFSHDEGEEVEQITRTVSISVFASFTFIFLVGLIGNILVVTVVVANPLMRSTTNILILNLALSDLLFVIFCVPFTAIDYILNYWYFGDFMCRFIQYMVCVTCHASVYTLVMMSLDRFLAVVHPISSLSYRTERNALLAIKIIWFLIVLASIPWFMSHGEIFYIDADGDASLVPGCSFLHEGVVADKAEEEGEDEIKFNYPAFQITFFMTSYVIPLTLISALYVGMLFKLWKGQAPGGKPSRESSVNFLTNLPLKKSFCVFFFSVSWAYQLMAGLFRRGKRRVTQMVVAVVLAFAICWLPIQIVLVLKSMNPNYQSTLLITMQIVSHVLAYSSSCVNPVLYAFLSENFRKALKKVVKCGEKPRQTTTQHDKDRPTTNITRSMHLKHNGKQDFDQGPECADIV